MDSDYFSVLRIPLLQGRLLTRPEVLRGAHLAVISRTFAKRYFPDSDPIGRQILPAELSQVPHSLLVAPSMDQPHPVIGVVGDVRNAGLHRPILPLGVYPVVHPRSPGRKHFDSNHRRQSHSAASCHQRQYPCTQSEPGSQLCLLAGRVSFHLCLVA